jgi:hypothetical protein
VRKNSGGAGAILCQNKRNLKATEMNKARGGFSLSCFIYSAAKSNKLFARSSPFVCDDKLEDICFLLLPTQQRARSLFLFPLFVFYLPPSISFVYVRGARPRLLDAACKTASSFLRIIIVVMRLLALIMQPREIKRRASAREIYGGSQKLLLLLADCPKNLCFCCVSGAARRNLGESNNPL